MDPNMPGMNMNDMHMQEMSFHWSKNAIVLFRGWPGDSAPMYLLALLLVFITAATAELLSPLAAVDKAAGTIPTLAGYSRAFVYALRIGLAYLVMLAVMSFNGGIFIAAIVGHVVGFFMTKVGSLRRSNKQDDQSDV